MLEGLPWETATLGVHRGGHKFTLLKYNGNWGPACWMKLSRVAEGRCCRRAGCWVLHPGHCAQSPTPFPSSGFAFRALSTMPGPSPRCCILHPPHESCPSPWRSKGSWQLCGDAPPPVAQQLRITLGNDSYSLPKKNKAFASHPKLIREAIRNKTARDPVCRISSAACTRGIETQGKEQTVP